MTIETKEEKYVDVRLTYQGKCIDTKLPKELFDGTVPKDVSHSYIGRELAYRFAELEVME